MHSSRHAEDPIDVEGDSLEIVAKKLGVELEFKAEKITLREDRLSYLNHTIDEKGNTLLMEFAKLGRADIVEFLLKCDGLGVDDENRDHETAAEIAWKERQLICLLKLLQGDAELPFTIDKSKVDDSDLKEFLERREKLHDDVRSGDLQSVIDSTRNQKPSKYLSLKFKPFTRNQSALSLAAECNQLEVFAYLLNHGAKFKDSGEEKRCTFNDQQKDKLNQLLDEYFVKVDDSHVLKLMHASHSPQVFTDERKAKIKDVYHRLNSSHLVRLTMEVLEYEDFDVIFDFESKYTDRLYCVSCRRIYGLTVPDIKKIFIGAGECESVETAYRDVAGTLAHELCHMAMQVLFGNDAKPYEKGEEGSEMFKEYSDIVRSTRLSCEDPSADIDPVIKMVYKDYPSKWHAELIVRVPQVVAMYGDVDGKALLQKQVNDLYEFYSEHVVAKCRSYANPAFFKKRLCMIEHLHLYHGYVQEMDKETSPLKHPFRSFKDHSIRKGNISVIPTDNLRLSCLHVYHELKVSYSYHMDKRCLFFKMDCFQSNWGKIMNAFKCRVCRWMVLVADSKMLDFEELSKDFDDIEGCGVEKIANSCEEVKEVVVIVCEKCEGLGSDFSEKVLSYQWRDLSEDYKHRIVRQKVNFKGKETSLTRWITKEELSKIIQPEDMRRLTNYDLIELGDGEKLDSQGYIKYYYVERDFVKLKVEASIFDGLPDSTALFVTGLKKEDLEGVGVDKGRVQWVERPNDLIDNDKRIFIPLREVKSREFFEEFLGKRPFVDSIYWLHISMKDIYLRLSKGSKNHLEEHTRKYVFTERQLIETSKDRIVLISDDPGTGKSTVVTELIKIIRDERPEWWVGRIDVNNFADGKENPLGLANIEEDSKPEDVLNIFVLMLGMKTSLEVHLFKKFIMPRGLKRQYKIFIDGFDEVTSLYKENVFKLFRVLIEETTLQLWITTRKHESLDLETEFDTFSYSMEQFKVDQQVRFLERFWKHKMKSLDVQNSQAGRLKAIAAIGTKIGEILEEVQHFDEELAESLTELNNELEKSDCKATCCDKLEVLRLAIDSLDFTRCATMLVSDASIDEEKNRFMGIPLHLFMLGNVAYDNNFRRGVYFNVHRLYSEFSEGKIKIYWKEKGKIQVETGITKKLFNIQRKEIIRFHKRIAECVMEPDSHSWDSVVEDEEREIDVSVGIVTKMGDHYQFIHRTFAEYFFCERLLEMIKFEKLKSETMKDVLIVDKYSVVRRFLNGAFQSKDTRKTLKKTLMKKWNLTDIFNNCIEKVSSVDSDCMFILRLILAKMEKEFDHISIRDFVFETSKFLQSMHWNVYMNVFKLLSFCFSRSMLFDLFDSNFERTFKGVFNLIRYSSPSDVGEILEMFENIHLIKESESSAQNLTGAHPEENQGGGSEKVTAGSNDRKRLGLFDAVDDYGGNVFNYAVRNRNEKVCVQVISFAKNLLGEEGTKKCLLMKDCRGKTFLHASAHCRSGNVITALREISTIVDYTSMVELFREKTDYGYTFLHESVVNCLSNVIDPLFEYLRVTYGGDVLKELLLEKDDLNDMNIFHLTAHNGDINVFAAVLRELRNELENDEEFTEFVSSANETYGTVFHHRVHGGQALSELFVLESYIGIERLRELLCKTNKGKETCLHTLMKLTAYGPMIWSRNDIPYEEFVRRDVCFFAEVLDDGLVEGFFLAKDEDGNTLLHCAAVNGILWYRFKDILCELKRILGESTLQALINVSNVKGERVRIVEDGGSVKLELCVQDAI